MPVAQRKRGPKRLDEIENPVLRRILEVTRWSQNELSRQLHFDATHFSRREGEGRPIPEAILERVAWRTGCRKAWLETGELPIYEEVQGVPQALQAVIHLMREAPPEAQAVLNAVAQVLATGQSDAISPLMTVIAGITAERRQARLMAEDDPADGTPPSAD